MHTRQVFCHTQFTSFLNRLLSTPNSSELRTQQGLCHCPSLGREQNKTAPQYSLLSTTVSVPPNFSSPGCMSENPPSPHTAQVTMRPVVLEILIWPLCSLLPQPFKSHAFSCSAHIHLSVCPETSRLWLNAPFTFNRGMGT